MRIVVIGGGYVGQLVQYAVPTARVLDWRKKPPKDHMETRIGPQYLWEPIPGLPSTSFTVTTLVDGKEPTMDAIIRYKKKIGKERDGGDWGLQFQFQTTGYHSELPEPTIEFDRSVRMVDTGSKQIVVMPDWMRIDYDILVSTIPLPAFLGLLFHGPTWGGEDFKHDPIYMANVKAKEPIEGMILNYLSDPHNPWYRETCHRDRIYRESIVGGGGDRAVAKLLPGKIHPHSRSEYVVDELRKKDVYCFGRFATWRPDELAHQTFKEISKWKEARGL